MRQVILYPGEDGYWVAECASLPGCITQGKTKEEALANIKEAIGGYIATLEELDRGTLRAIIRQAGLSLEDFIGLLT